MWLLPFHIFAQNPVLTTLSAQIYFRILRGYSASAQGKRLKRRSSALLLLVNPAEPLGAPQVF
jgi:hypothetical protein